MTSARATPSRPISAKRLIVRLSSLGDVVLATSALETLPAGECADWVVRKEFAPILEGHPRIGRLWVFDRGEGLRGWWRLCGALAASRYDEVYDLHRNLRSWILRLRLRPMKTVVVDKARWRLWGYFLFKKLWPSAWRPQPWVERFGAAVGKERSARPNLSYLARNCPAGEARMETKSYWCVMPGAHWQGKRWSPAKFFAVIRTTGVTPVVLGSANDRESALLVKMLEEAGIPHVSGVGRWNLRQVAAVLGGARCLLTNDTGLAHVAEAMGTPALVIFGPTRPEMGFGPWGEESRSVGVDIWCRPCGKDGRHCFRVDRKYACLDGVTPETVSREVARVLEA